MTPTSLSSGMARSLADLAQFHDGEAIRLERQYGEDPLQVTINQGGIVYWEYLVDKDGTVFVPSADDRDWEPQAGLTPAQTRERAKKSSAPLTVDRF